MMLSNSNRLVNTAAVFIILTFITALLYLGQEILFPLFMSMLMAILLRPVMSFLNRRLRFPNIVAALFSLFLGVVVIAGLIFFMSRQISQFTEDLPLIKQNLNHHIHHVQEWIHDKFNVSYKKQATYIQQTVSEGNMLDASTLNSFTGAMMNLILIPAYTFLILIYRTLFMNFFIKLFPRKNHGVMRDILFQIKTVVRSYIVGLLLEMTAVAVLTSLGLWLIGVDYFIFLGVLTAILNLIPYIGILVAGTISVIVALIGSTELSAIFGVIVVNIVVQFIDNNILVPKIVGSKVSINALASIVGVIIGGTLAGVAGMFLAIPVIAILKVIFDRIDSLKPWGYLLGDNIPKTINWHRLQLPNFNVEDQAEEGANDESEEKANEPDEK